MPPNFVPEKSNHRLTPVTLAAVGPKMLSLAGEVADGVQLHPFCTRAYVEKCVLPQLEKGFKKSDMRRENFEISGGGFIVTGTNDQEVSEMIDWVRYRIGFYASTPAYWPVLEHSGYDDLGPKLNRLTKEGKWDKLAENIPDDLLHECAAIGRHELYRRRDKKALQWLGRHRSGKSKLRKSSHNSFRDSHRN
jgi:alkanesulfonate monooxygenase SsuD/methylene tetrahydromethanopterin reductase-like flavin-dependent oxidoreductase (luciferase family)